MSLFTFLVAFFAINKKSYNVTLKSVTVKCAISLQNNHMERDNS